MRAGATAILLVALAVPAAAQAARPVEGQWYNGSQARGGFIETEGRSIERLWLFCRSERFDGDPNRPEYRASRYEVPWAVRVKRDGTFAYRGKAYRFGAEGQPLGVWKVRLKGRFVTPRRARIERRLEGCDKATITVRADA
jgi:hypothetical protein